MKTLILIFLVSIPSLSFSQINFKHPPWKLGCDTMGSQLERNVCSLQAFNIADSILNKTYKQLISYIDRQYREERKTAGNSKDRFEIEYLAILKKEKAAVVASQASFIEFRDNTTDIIGYENWGGSQLSMQNFEINTYALELTVNQLKTIAKMSKEIMFQK